VASRAAVVAAIVATIAFAAYTRTLLPGVDMGDTAAFQAAVLWPEVSARQAYPLYYALAKPFVAALAPDNPARGLNLFSALWAAVACGLLTLVVALVTGSVAGGAAGGLLLAFSYTFWTQAVIAEVYSLHLALVGCCLVALVAWWQRPSTGRLALFFAIYALGFGNHLSMILLLVPFAVFLLMTATHPRDLVRPRVALLALAIAIAGAMQYLPQFMAVWTSLDAPLAAQDRVAAFWFDVTKSDWRDSMVMTVRGSQFGDRLAMFAFDARQQFGVAGIVLAAAGAVALWRKSRAWAVLVLLAYVANTLFAFTYNVGDPHVFFLPGHFFAAFAAGAALTAATERLGTRRVLASVAVVAVLAYAAWRGYDTWPAADRHRDRRAERLITLLTVGLDDRTSLLAARVNWQVENALIYETRYRLRQVVWTRLSDVMLHFPLIVRDNQTTGRDVVLTAGAVPPVASAFGPLLPIVPDAVPAALTIDAHASRIRRGTPYVLTILAPTRDEVLVEDEVNEALAVLTGGRVKSRSKAAFEVVVGRAGDRPLLRRSDARPFRQKLDMSEGTLDIRMDAWVPAETFRRGGFGHVILDRERLLVVERGVSLATFDSGEPFYTAGIYAIQPRFRIPAAGLPRLALLH
jgi:hypothetical protein